jgi:tetratricopeptide (TPR) repeat protein
MDIPRIFFASFLLLSFAMQFAAQSHAAHDPARSGTVDLGVIEFPNSGAAEAQNAFINGVLLLHSFEYDAARKAFVEAQQADKDFALAYWGEAMTYDHPIWPENDRAAALSALAKLAPTPAERRSRAKSPREQMYMDAVERLYGEGDVTARAAAYSAAMEKLADRFPDDLEARAFYSLSILGLTRTTRNTENYMRAAAIAESIYEKNPRHPGALHYLIHSYDDPVHAPLGLRAARVYGSIARSASHAQHMPSHIFFALGMWEDSIRANTDSMKTARDSGGGGYHALHWLLHGYLQLGKIADAMRTLAIIEDDANKITTGYTRTHLAMCRATMLVETQRAEPASLLEPVDATGINSIAPFSNHDLAIGLEYVRRKDLAAARDSLAKLRSRMEKAGTSVTAGSGSIDRYSEMPKADLDAVGVMALILEASIDTASGDQATALRKIVAAAEAEDKLIFEYGPPAIVKPAWEAVGEMYLSAGKKAEAANAFRRALKRYPNRRISNEGLKQASK